MCDQSTVEEQARRITEEYGVKEVVFAADRGMLTPQRIEEVNAMGFKTLTALTHPQLRELLERKVVQMDLFDEKQIIEVNRASRKLPELPMKGNHLRVISHKNVKKGVMSLMKGGH
jgi:sigma54-dependent transcription regulator